MAFAPVRIKEVGPAASAALRRFNMLVFEPRLHKLGAAYGPEIKVIVPDHEGSEAFREDLLVRDEFRAAGA